MDVNIQEAEANVQINEQPVEQNETKQKPVKEDKRKQPKSAKQMEALKKAQEARKLRLILKKKQEEKEIDDILEQLAKNRRQNRKQYKEETKYDTEPEEEEEQDTEPVHHQQPIYEPEDDEPEYIPPPQYDYVETLPKMRPRQFKRQPRNVGYYDDYYAPDDYSHDNEDDDYYEPQYEPPRRPMRPPKQMIYDEPYRQVVRNSPIKNYNNQPIVMDHRPNIVQQPKALFYDKPQQSRVSIFDE